MTGYYVNSSSENILQFTEPDSYYGRVRKYSIGHSELVIDVGISGERSFLYTLVIDLVEYVELPMTWVGLNLCVASDEECWEMLGKIGKLGSYPSNIEIETKERLRELYRLYQFRTPRGTYRVLAAHTLVNLPYDG
ncbi:MAG: hypothetical protein R3E39_04110 [Anaerolineae bacterium]